MSFWITLVGGGGKTTTMFHLAKYFCERNKSVILTTTTNIAKFTPGDYGVDALGILFGEGNFLTKQEIESRMRGISKTGLRHDKLSGEDFRKSEHEIYVIASHEKDGKWKGLSPEQCANLDGLADVILTEGDGAKYLPIKVPAKHEPVIPRETDLVLVCMGMDAVFRRAAQVCFRFEKARELFGFSEEHVLTEEDAAKILTSEFGGRKDVGDAKVCFILNKSDDAKRVQSAKKIAESVMQRLKKNGDASSEECVYLTCYKEGEYYRPITESGFCKEELW